MSRGRGPTWLSKPEDYQQIFNEQNPWRAEGKIPDVLARPVERSLAKYLWSAVEKNDAARFQIVMGPRRVGKSTVMYQTVRRLLESGVHPLRVWWMRVDHPLLMDVELGTLVKTAIQTANASQEAPVYLFLDEVTYSRDWDLWLKTFYDEKWPLKLIGSSSATAALRERRMESGVGRWEEQHLAPYLFTEFLELAGIRVELPLGTQLADSVHASFGVQIDATGLAAQRRRFLLTGGFPELLMGEKQNPADEATILLQSQRTLRSDAVERAIYKDIPQAFGVDDPLMLERLLYTLAGQFTGILSPNHICGTLGGLSQPTFDRYLSYLERAFLVFTLPNYSGNETTRQRRGRKLYFVDSAVRNAALQRGLAPLGDHVEMGLLLENMVAGHLHALSQQSQVRVYHWHEKGQEVDLIYDHPGTPMAFEIGSTVKHHRDGLYAFEKKFPRFTGNCFVVSPDAPPVRPADSWDGIGTLPLDLLLLILSAQAESDLRNRLAVATV